MSDDPDPSRCLHADLEARNAISPRPVQRIQIRREAIPGAIPRAVLLENEQIKAGSRARTTTGFKLLTAGQPLGWNSPKTPRSTSDTSPRVAIRDSANFIG